jgi:sugar phosphate isomerase/epimerase
MIKSAVTISLVPEARGGPFIFWDGLEDGCRKAKEFGFDAIELFAPDAESIRSGELRRLLEDLGLRLAGAGTGAGWIKHKLTLTSPDASLRRRGRDFVRSIIEAAGELGAPAIIGSMQGRWGEGVAREAAVGHLRDALDELAQKSSRDAPLLFEPLNRYETNLFNTLERAAAIVPPGANVKILADLFHMNIEEADMAVAIGAVGYRVGHVHFADSNRRPVGLGHTQMAPVVAALRDIGYDGYVSAEALPYPDPDAAARQTMLSFRKYFR